MAELINVFRDSDAVVIRPTTDDTTTELLKVLNSAGTTVFSVGSAGNNISFTNVKESFGAVGNGTTDDTAAIQSAINAVNAAGGGIVFLPQGNYKISSPGLVMPENAQVGITLQGAGMGGSGTPCTRIVRTGAHAMLTATGTGITGPTVNNGLCVKDLTFWDSGFNNAAAVVLTRCAHVTWHNVRIVNINSYALQATQLWNSSFLRCNFETSGNLGSTIPAVLLTSSTDSNSDTVEFLGCYFEDNVYTDIVLDADNVARRATAIALVGCKHERAGGIGVHFKASQYCVVSAGQVMVNSALPAIKFDTNSFLNKVVGSNMVQGGGSPAYLVQASAGQNSVIAGNTFIGATTAHIRVESGFGAATIWGNQHFQLGAEVPLSDARVAPTVNGDFTVSGAKAGNVALTNLMVALNQAGVIKDNTS